MAKAIVIGVSAGGLHALKTMLPMLPAAFPSPLAIVQHLDPHADSYLSEYLNQISAITVKEAEDKEMLIPGTAYVAPPGYHLLIEPDGSFSLSVDEKVNFSRPSIDLLFESAADAFGQATIGIVLTGANADGAKGLHTIKARGGLAIVQNPETAQVPYMPKSAIEMTHIDYIVNLERIAPLLVQLLCKGGTYGTGTKG